MPFKPSELSAEIKARGILKTNKFDIVITTPRGLTTFPSMSESGRLLTLYGESAAVPGVASLTHDVRRFGYGPTEKKPVHPMFTDWVVTFRVDGSGRIQDFFRQWMRLITNFEMVGPDGNGTIGTRNGPMTGQYVWELAYKNDFATEAVVTAYSDNGAKSISVNIHECWPIYVGDLQFDWSRNNEYARLPVTFTYSSWSSGRIQAIGAAPQQSDPGSYY